MKNQNRNILLTFDVEEFDLPLDYGIKISLDEQMHVGKTGLDAITEILDRKSIKCTLFTTANFALKYPSHIAALSENHEIASHAFFHSSFKREDLKNSREVLEDIISKKVTGLRMPRMKKIESGWIKDAGFTYDCSVNPTWIPGRYNNLRMPRGLYLENDIIRVPASVSINFRVPLFWLSFKNLPYTYFRQLAVQCLKKDGYLSLYFHPWEFIDLSDYRVPLIIKRNSGMKLLNKLKKLISDLNEEGEFVTTQSFIQNPNKSGIIFHTL